MEMTAQAVLNALAFPDGELSILLVDDPRIEQLNGKYLNRQGPTNVIAFPMREGPFGDLNPHLLGDVVISTDTAASEAQGTDITAETRITELLIHGILHLFGYDHENDDAEARRMEQKSDELMTVVSGLEADRTA
jgi:probable rRNA maturation factor